MNSSPTNEGGHFKVKNVPERKCFFFQNFQRRVQGFSSVVVVVAFQSLSRNDYSILCGVDSSATGWSITVTCSTSKRRKSCVSVSWTCHGVSYCLLWSPQLKCLTLRALRQEVKPENKIPQIWFSTDKDKEKKLLPRARLNYWGAMEKIAFDLR